MIQQLNPANRPSATLLSGQSVRLERLNLVIHGDALWETTGGPHHAELWQYMAEGPFANRPEFNTALELASAKEDPQFFAIVDQTTNRAMGRASYLNVRPEHGVIEVGHLLFSPLLQRTRGATEALYLLAKYAFDDLGYRRYEWKCNALNAKSRSAAQRLGFTLEGVFRQHMIVKGSNRDTAWFSILDTEWPRIRQAFQAWLDPENFDAQGLQRRSLGQLLLA